MNKALKLTAGLIAAGTIVTATAPSISSFYNVSANELAKGNYSSSKATTLKQAEKRAVSENGEYTHKQTQKDSGIVKTSTESTNKADNSFNQISNSDDVTTSTKKVDSAEIETAINTETQKVSGIKVSDSESKTDVSVINNGVQLTVIKTTFDSETAKYTTETHVFDLANNNGTEAVASSFWHYTGVAIGARFFAYTVDTAVCGLTAAAIVAVLPEVIAGALGITASAASSAVANTAGFSIGYLATLANPGTRLASLFDGNGNGWIGIYKHGNLTYCE
ncbi:hypothetical protein [Leuconostoc mesenteroides]|uniref:hypothetical protein n=1 Tax=Leuconostoc mesenteroides TaxID=1245 RepID=UPI000CF95C38|nr:hypothetical protein [Leuconostoc mesenteroides]SPE70465.1 hypothetical protein LEM9217_01623 [Leuconostoc mesenteroides]